MTKVEKNIFPKSLCPSPHVSTIPCHYAIPPFSYILLIMGGENFPEKYLPLPSCSDLLHLIPEHPTHHHAGVNIFLGKDIHICHYNRTPCLYHPLLLRSIAIDPSVHILSSLYIIMLCPFPLFGLPYLHHFTLWSLPLSLKSHSATHLRLHPTALF